MKKYLPILLLLGALVACTDEPRLAPPTPSPSTSVSAHPLLDLGNVETVVVTSQGVGSTPGAAVNEALKTAIMQVNHIAVISTRANIDLFTQVTNALDEDSGRGHDPAKARSGLLRQAFADQIISQSQGIVSSFKVLNISAPFVTGMDYKIDIQARVAKFKLPIDRSKTSIVLAPLRSQQTHFMIGGLSVPAEEILALLHRQIIDELAETGRFNLIERSFESEIKGDLETILRQQNNAERLLTIEPRIEGETAMASSGTTANTALIKLGQALGADLLWVCEVENFVYNVRPGSTASPMIITRYSGDWQVSARLINLATQQIQPSKILQGQGPAHSVPSGVHAKIDLQQISQEMQTNMVRQATEDILLRSQP